MENKEYYIRLGEAVERLEEKNCPTNPSKWSSYKSQAKKKFDVYPSAYANGWASKQYGDAGGGWKKCASEATDAEEKMNEKFDRTHLGILKYAYKDIDKINPSDPMYVRVAQMLDKLSKQELQQLIDADIKFISLLAKNRLSKKESVNESHFQVGDKVKMSHGGVGVVKSLDKEDGGDDEKYYNIELPNGEVMKHAPNELTLAETDLKEGLYQDIMRGVKKGDSPFTLVVIKNNKVVKQVEVKTGQAIPANYSLLLKEFPNSRIRIEDATGKIVMGESVNEASNDYSPLAYAKFVAKGKISMEKAIKDTGYPFIILAKLVKAYDRNYKFEGVMNEGHFGEIDIMAQNASNFREFAKDFYKEYKDFPKDKDTLKWLKSLYDGRSKDESVESLDEKLPNDFATIPNDSRVSGMMKHLQHHVGVIGKNVKAGKGVYKKDLMKMANIIKALQMYESKSVNEGVSPKDMEKIKGAVETASSFMNIGVELKKTGMRYIFATSPMPIYVVQDKSGNRIAIVNKKYATKPDFVHGDTAVGVMESILKKKEIVEGNAFTGALFKAREEGLTEFEFNGKMYPVKKLEEKEETLSESKLTKDSLKQIIKEEYHNVKTFMEEKYGFTPELGKVYSNLAAKPFLKEEEEEVIEEYDVENYEDLKEFVQFMAEYKSDINEAEYQGRKVKLGKIMQGDVKKFKVYVKNDKGNVVKVNFGQGGDAKGGTMRIRKDNPEARKSFRARHNCDNPGPRWKARYWSCRKW
jgi:hypothetical protein